MHRQIGMVILAMRDVCDRVDERNRLVIVREPESLAEPTIGVFPGRQNFEMLRDFRDGQPRRARAAIEGGKGGKLGRHVVDSWLKVRPRRAPAERCAPVPAGANRKTAKAKDPAAGGSRCLRKALPAPGLVA